ncbi:MAG: ribosomal-protein-alanine N-acetyltransferase [Planctomycetaceae bacterium TMED241]|uniref:ribosomal protein S18-alanine N-acetyltransferase n=1 Tax=Parasynechococcus sp. TaxID=3101203 RepID=UPI000B6F943A|nr:MAG: ribosomal-protein-alanine N-acetyltransferase [Synechococcus sp. MED-G70]RPG10783.1 MAG: ribosomal-protein-alanine N-acetyltransferase [Planctomycetaceae bacterium TMED241]HCX53693.1 ribosomal-protein-alanine N-acetyltransferase [Synechococcus sp. UBA9887]|tara:strand:+ start:5553 stop:6038 length:486 start_codon:yes stop_codon:yes gene_type:complete
MGNVGIRAPRNGSAITVIELDTSWLSACLDLDQRCLRGLWNEEQWRRELEEPQRLCLGLIEGERLLGLACGWLVVDELHITAVAVDPDRRRCGLGRSLLDALLQRARMEGARHATLEVASDNTAAVGLYDSHGFQIAGRRPNYYRDGRDALIQWCRLTPTG